MKAARLISFGATAGTQPADFTSTLAACGPFGPSTISKSTASPSFSVRHPSPTSAVYKHVGAAIVTADI
jgi:hypothetical protein